MRQNDAKLRAQGNSIHKQKNKPAVEKKKVISIAVLMATAIGIVLFGTIFSIFSVVYNISFPVMNSQIHGAVFGLVTVFLGVRYLLSVQKLKAEVYKSTSKFSWGNFKKEKVQKCL